MIADYRQLFVALEVEAAAHPHDALAQELIPKLAHCHQMLSTMEQLVREDRMEKVFRWLGFLQGVLWSHGIFTLQELKEHSAP